MRSWKCLSMRVSPAWHADRQRLAVCHAKLDDIGAVALRAEDHDTVLAAYRRFFLLHSSSLFALHGRRVGQALAPKAIAERLRSGGVWEAESHIEWLDLVSTPATADRDASFTMERINLLENTAKAFRRKCEFDQMRKVPFVRKPDELAFATSHLTQSSSASRLTAGASGFLLLIQCRERPER